nr:reverse transcriptase domain-containing protein [Tanacetum cinerariifolium]
MEELRQPSLNGRGGSIAAVNIQATDFGLKNHMIQQVQQSCQYHGLPGDDATKQIDKFFTISIHRWEEMVIEFLSKYFPPSNVTKLRNDISNFRHLLDEYLFEAWERYKFLIDRFPNHSMWPKECYDLIESMTAHHNDWDTSAQRGGGTRPGDDHGPALAQTPKYAKMLKDLITIKEKLLELANTPLNENCSAVLQKKLLEKLRDPGKFLILCDFSELEECLALADLGASINLMPLSVWKNLMLPKLKPTRMTLELVNRPVAYPVGIAEDVFVQVGNFTFHGDFVVVDYDVDPHVPLTILEDDLPTLSSDPVVASLSPSLTPFGDSGFVVEDIDAFLALDDSITLEIDNGIYDSEGDIIFLAKLLIDDPVPILRNEESDESETETIMEEVQIYSSQSTAQILPSYRKLTFNLTMP